MLTGDDDIGGGGGDVLYGDLTLTVGYGIAAAVLVPVCLMDLKENVGWQIFGFLVLCVNSVQFAASFIWYGLDTANLPLFGHGFDRMIGVILFNFSLVVAVPAWLHEKRPDVDVHTVVYTASFLATVLYILVGTFGALAIPNVNSNVLEPMVSGAFGPLMRISASFFAFVNIGLDIPLFRYVTDCGTDGWCLVVAVIDCGRDPACPTRAVCLVRTIPCLSTNAFFCPPPLFHTHTFV